MAESESFRQLSPLRTPTRPARSTSDSTVGAQDGMRPDHAAVLELQRDAGNAAVAQMMESEDPHGIQRVLSGGGQALDGRSQAEMGSALGADFSDVRVHVGEAAHTSAQSLGANAYTMGSDIVFAAGRYDPASDAGRRTLAHELTHVVQQRSGPVAGTPTGTGVSVSDPSDQFEQAAEASAERVVNGGLDAGHGGGGADHDHAPAPVAQREDDAAQRDEDEQAEPDAGQEDLDETAVDGTG